MLIFATLVSACVCVWVLCVCVYSQTNAGGGRGRSRARVNTQTQGTLVAYPPSDARAAARRAFMSAAGNKRQGVPNCAAQERTNRTLVDRLFLDLLTGSGLAA